MEKKKVYLMLFIFMLILDVVTGFSISGSGALPMLVASWVFKLGLGITGLVYYKNEKVVKKTAIRENQAVLLPFYVVLVVLAVSLFSLISVSLSFGGIEGLAYIVALVAALLLAVGALFYWELDFVRTIENTAIRVIYGILTPLSWFVITIIYVFMIEIE